jgi:glycosyltransferase involved in cell wall biosynthesis
VRIGIIAPPWMPVPPAAYGGIEAVVDNLARGLQAAGEQVLLFTVHGSTCPVRRATAASRRHGSAPSGLDAPAIELQHVVAAYEAMLAWGADVVHDHTLIGPVHGARLPVRVVTTNHGPFVGTLDHCYRSIAGSVPVVAISHHQAATATATPIAAVIHHGIDVESVPVGPGDGGYALFLGRMSPDKGVDTAARVARRAGVPLTIACRLEERAEHDYFHAAVEPLLGGSVGFVGEVGGVAKSELIGRATCLLNPIAWAEPFGMVMIEALAHGTPIVATPRGSVPELVDDGVTGFVRASEPQLVQALRRVSTLDRARCRRTALERFSTARMVAEHRALYAQVLDGRHPSRAA